ncbi:MAG: ELM1/GtrOC1 family putative glycosyltransferase [Candidatus Omnitrophota bacterium]
MQLLPLGLTLWFGRFLGSVAYFFDTKRKRIAYSNLKLAFASNKTPQELKKILKKTYQNLGQNIIEVLRLPKVNEKYVDKFIEFDSLKNINQALKNKKGVILLATHFGSWEMYFVSGPLKGYPLRILARDQKNKYLADLLDFWRKSKGCQVLYRGVATREIIRALKSSQIVGMVMDQGGKTEGIFSSFFGKRVMTPTGAIRFALDLNASILPAYVRRKNGPYHKITIMPEVTLDRTGNKELDLVTNLEKLNRIAEDYISKYPEEYFWFHKRWKYSPDRWVTILSDGKTGHLRQSEAIAKLLEETDFKIKTETIEIKFKSNFHKFLLNLCAKLSNRNCQGCMYCLKFCLMQESYDRIIHNYADMVISCGSSLAGVNLFLSRELNARSVILMKPGLLNIKKFDLVIVPKHDKLANRKNIIQTLITPNLVDQNYLKEQLGLFLKNNPTFEEKSEYLRIGVLLGGDTKHFSFTKELSQELVKQIKDLNKNLNFEILVSTSRRSPKYLEDILKQEFTEVSFCKLLIVARENNIPEAVGAILGLSEIMIVSGDSISMVSEAVSSGKKVIVFKLEKITSKNLKHEIFLDELAKKNYIKLIEIKNLSKTLIDIKEEKITFDKPEDTKYILERLKGIL